jgi:hypothetical protein
MHDDGWDVVCRLQQNRWFHDQVLRTSRCQPSGAETGRLPGGLKVLVVGDGATYVATHRLTLAAAEGRRLSRVRAPIAAVMKVWKDPRRLPGGQARSDRAQPQHVTGCLVACYVLARARHERHLSLDHLKRLLSFQGRSVHLPALERLRTAA